MVASAAMGEKQPNLHFDNSKERRLSSVLGMTKGEFDSRHDLASVRKFMYALICGLQAKGIGGVPESIQFGESRAIMSFSIDKEATAVAAGLIMSGLFKAVKAIGRDTILRQQIQMDFDPSDFGTTRYNDIDLAVCLSKGLAFATSGENDGTP